MSRKLKSLAEANAAAFGREHNPNAPRLNGIACPNCGAELFDSEPMITLTSCPGQKTIHCACGFRGTRFV